MRNPARALVVASGVTAALLTAAPAFAESANDPGPSLTVSETLGLFVAVPALVIGIVYAVVYALTGLGQPRYRQGGDWTEQPRWWNGAADAQSALAAAEGSTAAVTTAAGGGASAEW